MDIGREKAEKVENPSWCSWFLKKTFQVLAAEISRDVDQLNVEDESGSAGDLSGHLDDENGDDDDDIWW